MHSEDVLSDKEFSWKQKTVTSCSETVVFDLYLPFQFCTQLRVINFVARQIGYMIRIRSGWTLVDVP